jgi:hypothetical protein
MPAVRLGGIVVRMHQIQRREEVARAVLKN